MLLLFHVNTAAAASRGVATSLLGTFIYKSQHILYALYEYEINEESEYTPRELGYTGNQEFLGKSTLHEALIFYSYGLSDYLAIEMEAALYTNEKLERDSADMSGIPDKIEESGLGEIEAQLRYRFSEESIAWPEFFGYTEIIFPFQKDKKLIGAHAWEIVQGFGIIKEFIFGTMAIRSSAAYDFDEKKLEMGEYAVEYFKDLSSRYRLVTAIEGEDDEISWIGEIQLSIGKNAILKLNTGIGLTEKAADFAPELGLLWNF